MYQGTVVDHKIKIKVGFGGTHTTANWEPLIQEMGNSGWELACILETPETHLSGMTTFVMKCKLFFQRPLLPQMGAVAPGPVPPSYEAVVGGQGAPLPAGFQVPPAPEKMGHWDCVIWLVGWSQTKRFLCFVGLVQNFLGVKLGWSASQSIIIIIECFQRLKKLYNLKKTTTYYTQIIPVFKSVVETKHQFFFLSNSYTAW